MIIIPLPAVAMSEHVKLTTVVIRLSITSKLPGLFRESRKRHFSFNSIFSSLLFLNFKPPADFVGLRAAGDKNLKSNVNGIMITFVMINVDV